MVLKYFIYRNFLLIFCLIILLLSFYSFLRDSILYLKLSFLDLNYQILGDWISFSFLFLVGLISSQVLKYSIYYIRGEVYYNRFGYLVLLFVLSMIFLIISSDGLRLLLGWDGLGITSYALIIFYSNPKSSSRAIITALRNRVGDVLIL